MEHCEDYPELISAGIDGQLTGEELQKLNDHLARCPDCRALYDIMAENDAALAGLGDCEPPEGFAQSVMERIQAERTPGKIVSLFRRPQFKKAMTAAACALLCIGVVRFSNGFFPMGSSPAEAAGGMEATGNAAPSSSLFVGSPGADGDAASSQLAEAPDSDRTLGDDNGSYGIASNNVSGFAKQEPSTSAPQYKIDSSSSEKEDRYACAYPFANPIRTRLDWSSDLTAGPYLINSREDLDSLLSNLSGDLDALSQQYSEQWFQEGGQLLAVVLTESSGSVSHQLSELRPSPDGVGVQVVIQRQVPQEDTTCDMAAWLVTAETDLPEDTALSLLLES